MASVEIDRSAMQPSSSNGAQTGGHGLRINVQFLSAGGGGSV